MWLRETPIVGTFRCRAMPSNGQSVMAPPTTPIES
jgi:hypothetical protein